MTTLLCVSYSPSTIKEALQQVSLVDPAYDVAEVRLDYLPPRDLKEMLPEIVAHKQTPLIATLRPHWEGGKWRGSDTNRLELLQTAAQCGFDYVDVEFKVINQWQPVEGCQCIVSTHDYQETPKDLELTTQQMAESGADILKVATFCGNLRDVKRLFDIIEQTPHPIIAVGMGNLGHLTRILAPKYGAYLVFCAPDEHSGTASGQIPLSLMLEGYHFRQINPQTQVRLQLSDLDLVSHDFCSGINHHFREQQQDVVCLPVPKVSAEDLTHFLNQTGFLINDKPNRQSIDNQNGSFKTNA